MKICIVTFQYPPMINGGVGSAVHRIATNLGRLGHEIHVISPGQADSLSSIQSIKENDVCVHRTFSSLGTHYGENHLHLSVIGQYVARLHEDIEFDLLHGFFLVPAGHLAVVLGKELNLPVVVSIRGSDVESFRYSPILGHTMRWVLEEAHIVTSVSEELLNKAKVMAQFNQYKVITNAFDINLFSKDEFKDICQRKGFRFLWRIRKFVKRNEDTFPVVGTVGLFRPSKGLTILLSAFQRVLEKYPNGHLLLVGDFADPMEKQACQNLIKKINIKKKVTITGRVPHIEILTWLQEMDVFTLPSLHEGSPNAVLEAMGAKVPVVATAVGGVPETIVDGVDGILVPPNDSKFLAEKILDICGNRALKNALTEAGWKKVMSVLSPEQETRHWMEIYQTAIKEQRHRSYAKNLNGE